MRASVLIATGALILSCGLLDSDQSPHVFELKFGNSGVFPITALYFKPVADTTDWGTNVLPVDTLHQLEYVWIHQVASGPEYAFKAVFDSSGKALSLVFATMWTGSVDTITAFGALSPDGNGMGYNWGHQFTEGEVLVSGAR